MLTLMEVILILLLMHIKFEKHKELKKMTGKELMPVLWHPNRWWNFSVSEYEKKR